MSGREQHVALEELAALAFAAGAFDPTLADGHEAERDLTHLAACESCTRQLADLTRDAEGVRALAIAHADALFDQPRLDAQRTRILDRLAQIGQTARVLSFPRRTSEVTLPAPSGSRRWVSVAAAAGLIIGLLAGQLLQFMPAGRTVGVSRDARAPVPTERPAGPMIVPASANLPLLSDDELMEEVAAAVQLHRAASLRALDGFTPTAAEMLVPGR